MAVVRNRLTLAVAEVDDDLAKVLVESEQWDMASDSPLPVHKKRAVRKPAAVESGE